MHESERLPSPNSTTHTLRVWKEPILKFIFKATIVGLVVGLFISLFRMAVTEALHLVKDMFGYVQQHLIWVPVLIAGALLLAWVIGLLIKSDPLIKGSGIPQVEGQLVNELHMNWLSVFIKKFVGGTLAIGSGLFLGREGPSIQLGAALGQGIHRLSGNRSVFEEKFLLTCGASAGLSAAFNAPLAGVLFVLEEVHRHFSPIILLTVMTSSVTADVVASQFFGLTPVLSFGHLESLPIKDYGFLLLLGAMLGVAGMIYNKTLLMTQSIYQRITWLPGHLHGIFPFILMVPLGLLAPQMLGGGHDIIVSLHQQAFSLIALVILLLVRYLFSLICYGSGLPGGIFLPMLALGSLVGAILGQLFVSVFGLDPMFVNNMVILAMAGFFTAVVKAPITGSLLITEMTGSFATLLPVIIVSLTAYVISDLLKTKPIYEELLHRLTTPFKEAMDHQLESRETAKELIEIPIVIGSKAENQYIRDLNWPRQALLIAVKRGGLEIIPKGDTKLRAGDSILILTDDYTLSEVKQKMNMLCTDCSSYDRE